MTASDKGDVMATTLSDGRVQHDDVIVGTCGSDCKGDLVPITGWGAWTDERCTRCGRTWCYQVPRQISEIAHEAEVEARARGAAKET